MKNVDPGTRPVAESASAVVDEPQTRSGAEHDASTRQRVAESILQHGPLTAVQLASRLDLTPAAIRRHLDALVECGQVSGSEQRIYGPRGRGRPAKVFALTDTGRAGFYHAYDELAMAALQELAEAGGEQAVSRLAQRRQAGIEERYASIRSHDGGSQSSESGNATEVLAAALSAEGYAATTEPAVAGQQLCQHHCPVAHVAAEFPQLCEAETETFSRLLGVHVQRLATIAHGDGVCTTHVPDAPEGVRETFRSQLKPGGRPGSSSTTQDQQSMSRKATAI